MSVENHGNTIGKPGSASALPGLLIVPHGHHRILREIRGIDQHVILESARHLPCKCSPVLRRRARVPLSTLPASWHRAGSARVNDTKDEITNHQN